MHSAGRLQLPGTSAARWSQKKTNGFSTCTIQLAHRDQTVPLLESPTLLKVQDEEAILLPRVLKIK